MIPDKPKFIGAVLPPNFSPNPDLMINYAKELEKIGIDFVVAYDHGILQHRNIAGRDKKERQFKPMYTSEQSFVKALPLLLTIAQHTREIKLFTGVVVLPQHQTTDI